MKSTLTINKYPFLLDKNTYSFSIVGSYIKNVKLICNPNTYYIQLKKIFYLWLMEFIK